MSKKRDSILQVAVFLFFAVVTLVCTTGKVSAAPDPDIKVYLNNQLLAFDVPPVVENGRTLVPMAAVFSAMGAEVRWDGGSQTVTAIRKGIAVDLKIGSLHPSVNGRDCTIDIPARIIKNRTMVPLGFVGEAFGGKVAWDPTNRVVNITLAASPGQTGGYVTVKEDYVNLRSGPGTGYDNTGTAPHDQQMEVLSQSGDWYQVKYQGKSVWVAGWLVVFTGQGVPNSPSPQPVPLPNNTTSAGELVLSYTCDGSGISFSMESSGKLQPTINQNGNDTVYQYPGFSLKDNKTYKEKTARGDVVIQASNQGNAVLVNISIPAGVQSQRKASEDGKKQVLLIPNCVLGVDRQSFDAAGECLIINTLLTPSCTHNQNGTIVNISLPGTGIGTVNNTYTFAGKLLKSVSFEPSINNSTQNLTIKVQTQNAVKYSILPGCQDENALFMVMMNPNDLPAPLTAVLLDAGHGGADSGACPLQVREKDVNLSIAMKVGAALNKKGIRVYYTRRDDSYVGLAERSAMSNLLNPALFVSMHNNSVDGNPDVNGTETYYYAPQDNPQLAAQKASRMRIATLLQQKLVNNLGFPDRGVKDKSLAVLRLTQAPCALAEVAFLSNPETAKLMQQDDYQTRAASAIVDAISEYLGISK
ncbi:MAG: N-acetylmuramoyl-L-alanine amidase [Syntrophomonas sp.]